MTRAHKDIGKFAISISDFLINIVMFAIQRRSW